MERALADVGHSLRQWGANLLPLISVNVLWVACSLTVILFPMATVALFLAANRSAYRQDVSRALFSGGMRLYARIALRWFAVYGAGIALWGGMFAAGQEFVRGVALAGGLWWSLLNMYAVALIVEQPRKRVRDAFRHALIIASIDPLYTLVNWLAIVLISLGMLQVWILPRRPFAPALIALIATHAILTQTRASGLPPDPDRAITL